MAPGADAVVAAVVVPVVGDDAGAVADLDLEARPGLHVEAEHPVVVVAAEPVRDRRGPRPTPGRTRAPTSSRSFVSNITWCSVCGQLERRPGQGEGVVALRCSGRSAPRARCPAASSISSQSDCARPRPSVRKRCDSSNAVVANTTWPKPDAVGEEPAGTSGDANGRAAPARPRTSSTRDAPRRDVCARGRPTRRAAVSSSVPSTSSKPAVGEPGDDRVEARPSSTASKPTARGVVGRTLADDEPVGLVVVAPGVGPVWSARRERGRSTSPKKAPKPARVGDLEAEVGELDVVSHEFGSSLGMVRSVEGEQGDRADQVVRHY